MRIISQDGMIDVPYEQVVIQRYKEKIYFLNKNLTGVDGLINDMEIATYSTEAKAQKAVEMLREAYAGLPIIMQNIKISEDVAEMFEKLKKQEICIQTSDNEPPKVEYVNNGYFQFPADDEVEV